MIVSSPIWHTRANWTRCRNGHRPRDMGTSTRGNAIRLHACQKAGCGSYALGIQCSALDVTVWYEVDAQTFAKLVETDTETAVLDLLTLAGYYIPGPGDSQAIDAA